MRILYGISVPEEQICQECNGTGMQKRNDGINITCPMCGGIGKQQWPKKQKEISPIISAYAVGIPYKDWEE